MTISTTTNRKVHSGNAVAVVFAYDFKILDQTHLKVYVDAGAGLVLKTLGADYTVSGVGAALGGNVTFTSAPPTGTANVVIARDVPYTQGTDYIANDGFPADTHEEALDKLTMLVQQVYDAAQRSIQLPLNTTLSGLTLPTPSASKLIGWNAAADALANYGVADLSLYPVSAFIGTLLDDIDAATARGTLGAAKSGANTDITSLASPTITTPSVDRPAVTNPDNTTQALTPGATIDWNLNSGGIGTLVLGAAANAFNAPTNLKKGTYLLKVSQDGTGGRTISSWNAVFKWPGGTAPSLTATASAVDIISFYCDGTNMYGMIQKDFR